MSNMREFEIVMRDETTKQFARIVVQKLTFPEAARAAYRMRCKKGFSWAIESIVKMGTIS